MRNLGQSVGADEMGPECRVTGSPWYLAAPDQPLAGHQVHGSDAMNMEGQDEGI